MPIPITCGCGKKLKVADGLAGKKVKCPGCGAALAVEGAAPRASESGYALPRKFASSAPAEEDAPEERRAPTSAPQPSGKVLWFLGIFLLLFGLIFAWVGWHLIGKASAAKTWPTVDGRIERSAVVSKQERKDGKTTIMYSADIVYSYAVKGQTYQSTHVKPGGGTSSSNMSSWAKADADKYPAGSRAVAHYDPANPSDACLETNAGAGPWIFLLVGVAVLAGGGAMIGFRIRAMVRPAGV